MSDNFIDKNSLTGIRANAAVEIPDSVSDIPQSSFLRKSPDVFRRNPKEVFKISDLIDPAAFAPSYTKYIPLSDLVGQTIVITDLKSYQNKQNRRCYKICATCNGEQTFIKTSANVIVQQLDAVYMNWQRMGLGQNIPFKTMIIKDEHNYLRMLDPPEIKSAVQTQAQPIQSQLSQNQSSQSQQPNQVERSESKKDAKPEVKEQSNAEEVKEQKKQDQISANVKTKSEAKPEFTDPDDELFKEPVKTKTEIELEKLNKQFTDKDVKSKSKEVEINLDELLAEMHMI